jgi:hypothetical protein
MRLIGPDHPVLNRWTFLCGLTLAAPLAIRVRFDEKGHLDAIEGLP